MSNRNTRLVRAALAAMALVLICAETASAQCLRRARRSSTDVQRYQWVVPVEQTSAITVRALLPGAGAELWVDGVRNTADGDTRVAVFAPKNSEGKSQYVIRVRWSHKDRVITDTRVAEVYPGDRVTLDFTRPDPNRTSEEIVPKEVPGPK